MTPGFLVTGFARFLIGLLERAGVQHLVVSPGSRSTPYLMAAKRFGKLCLHNVIDERSAAFVALGLSRDTRGPVGLLCTSGTAAANYLPALVEARLTGVPLIALTADRPVLLQDCAAPQTIDQTRLYGSHVVGAWSIAPPAFSRAELLQLKRLVFSGVMRAVSVSDPGPVHFNLHTPKPLETFSAQDDEDRAYEQLVASVLDQAPPLPIPSLCRPSDPSVDELCALVHAQVSGLITCGFDPEQPALDPLALTRFARASGYPVLLDAAHPLRLCCPAELAPYVVAPFEPLLRLSAFRLQSPPKTILQIGRPLTSSTWDQWLNSLETTEQALLARRGWPDPTGRARTLSISDPSWLLTLAASKLECCPPRSSGWQTRWLRSARVAADTINAALLTQASPGTIGELSAISVVLRAQPARARLVVGNSLPIRHLDFVATVGPESPNPSAIETITLRGASGIDGVTSVAVGVARARQTPVTLLIGDISFLHDIGALYAATEVMAPFAVVVLNNGGGRIFEQLPIGRVTEPGELDDWTTPHHLNLAGAASLYGLPHLRAQSDGELQSAVTEALSHAGTTIVEVLVTPGSAQAQTAMLLEKIADALVNTGLLPSGQARS